MRPAQRPILEEHNDELDANGRHTAGGARSAPA